MRPDEVEALARERLGAEVQAVTLLRATGDRDDGLRIWSVLAEHGTFWLVEGPAGPELLRPLRAGSDSVARAAEHYRALHPEAAIPAPGSCTCRACGAVDAGRARPLPPL